MYGWKEAFPLLEISLRFRNASGKVTCPVLVNLYGSVLVLFLVMFHGPVGLHPYPDSEPCFFNFCW